MATEAPGATPEGTPGDAGGAGGNDTETTPQGGQGGTEVVIPSEEEIKESFPNATAEEIAAIRANPSLAKVHGSMTRYFKERTTAISQQERELKEKAEAEDEQSRRARALVDGLRDYPREVIMALAQRNGLTLAEARREIEGAEDDEELVELFGDQWKEVAPSFFAAVDKRVQTQVAPIIAHLTARAEVEAKREIGNDIVAFKNEIEALGEKISPEVEKRMEELTEKLDPGEDVSNLEFLRYIYQIATGGQTRSTVTKEVVTRMQDSLKGREPEPVPSGGTQTGPPITDGMNLRESLRVTREWLKSHPQGR